MQTNEDQNSTQQNSTPFVSPGNYSPVTVFMQDTTGALFMGIFALLFMLGWIRSEARCHTLITHQEATRGSE